jgi:hypothetical protein
MKTRPFPSGDGTVRQTLAMRWNGSMENPKGHPQSRGLPVWFIVPREYHEAILTAAKLPAAKMTMVRNFLPTP